MIPMATRAASWVPNGWKRNLDGGLVWVHNETGEIVTVDPRTDPVDAELDRLFCQSVLAAWRSSGSKVYWRASIVEGGSTGSSTSMGTTSGSTWTRRRTGCSCMTRPVRGLISTLRSGRRLAERQNKRAEKADIKVRARRLEEETRAWTVLPEKESDDEYDDDDDEAALERARAKMEVAKTGKRERWTNSLTGEIRFLSQDAAFWMESRDADKNFCSVAASVLFMLSRVASLASPVRSTPSTRAPSQVSSTARPGKGFTTIPGAKDTDVPNVRRWKLECLNALRPAVYLGAGSRGSVGYGRRRCARQEGSPRDAQARAQERQDFRARLVLRGSAGQGALESRRTSLPTPSWSTRPTRCTASTS